MIRNRARERRALWIAALRERGPVMLVIAVLLAFAAWRVVGHWDGRLSRCLYAYERAYTPADTARVDMTPISARGRVTCLEYRRRSPDRYRRSIEAGRVQRRGTKAPLIEK